MNKSPSVSTSIPTPNISPMSSFSKNEETILDNEVSFVPDIQKMMYGLGDSINPNPESAELIETIVLEQIISLLNQASEISEIGEKPELTPEDILFLMKRNLKSVKRLIQYLGIKDELHSSTLRNFQGGSVPEFTSQDAVPFSELDIDSSSKLASSQKALPEWKKGRKKYCLAYLKKLNIEESDLNQLTDIVKENRMIRANNTALSLSSGAYEHFHKARCASFCSTNMTHPRFRTWLNQKGRWNEPVSIPVLEIILYLAKETIACVVDMVLTLREENDIRTKRTSISSAIAPDEIREAVRRCFFLHATSLSVFSRTVEPSMHRRLIAI